MATRTEELIAQEMAQLLAFFKADPRFIRLLDLAKDTTLAQKQIDFTAFIND